MNGRITHIQHFSLHDGPGVRTTVFFAGCNLACYWCHNPEAMLTEPRLQFFEDKCASCEACASACPKNAISATPRALNRERCEACGVCAKACFYGALAISSRRAGVDEVMADIAEDAEFYRHTGGGVTFSGGEPFLQPEFLSRLAEGCARAGIHSAADTAADLDYSVIQPVLPKLDLVICDLKAASDDLHRQGTGVSNERVLQNIVRLSRDAKRLWVRIPLIPGFNDSPRELSRMAEFLSGVSADRVELLPYHRLGGAKYRSLGLVCPSQNLIPPTPEQLARAKEYFE